MADDGAPARGTDALASYVHAESLPAVPEAVRRQARLRIVDTIAAIAAGHQFDEAATLRAFADTTFGDGPVTVLDGSGDRLNAPGGTLVNSVAANVLDVDDGHRLAQGHPAAVVTPALLAAVEREGGTVGDLVAAFIPAYEVAVRAALAMHAWAGLHVGSGSWGAVGAAGGVARILELPPDRTRDALGIAEFNAPITPVMRSVANPASSMTKDGIGWGGLVGMTAALLAERGVTGSGTVFDAIEYDGPDPSLVASLGDVYQLEEAYFKPYPACRWVHSGIDALDELLATNDIDVDAIQSITVHTHRKGAQLGITRPTTPSEAEYSYPFVVAATLVNGGTFSADELGPSSRSDETILSLADRVELRVDPEADDRYPEESLSRIELATDSGTFETGLVSPRGSRERPLSETELEAKWATLLDGPFGEGTAQAVADAVEDDERSVGALLAPLSDVS